MAKGKDARGGALEVKGFSTQNGQCTFSQADSSNEQTIRGGSGTSQKETGKVAGGAFSPEGAASGYPKQQIG
jgi:hypothetical protein